MDSRQVVVVLTSQMSAGMGSHAERQEFFATEAKPPCRFRDRALLRRMTIRGWGAEWQVLGEWTRLQPLIAAEHNSAANKEPTDHEGEVDRPISSSVAR